MDMVWYAVINDEVFLIQIYGIFTHIPAYTWVCVCVCNPKYAALINCFYPLVCKTHSVVYHTYIKSFTDWNIGHNVQECAGFLSEDSL